MKVCPVCKYSEEVDYKPPTEAELKDQQMKSLFLAHAVQPWWLSQPQWIAYALKSLGIEPKNLLDVGCGDGRWIQGLLRVFPNLSYTGIDCMKEAIEECVKIFPEHTWYLGDFAQGFYQCSQNPYFDVVLFGGTFNPKMMEFKQRDMLEKTKELAPEWIICLFDLNHTGNKPDKWILDKYNLQHEFFLPKNEQNYPRQNLVVWCYERKII